MDVDEVEDRRRGMWSMRRAEQPDKLITSSLDEAQDKAVAAGPRIP